MLRASFNQKISFLDPKLGEEIEKTVKFRLHFWQFCLKSYYAQGKPVLRGQGGSGSKIFFLMILIANLVYFHPLFTEFENLDPKVLNFADLSGWVGPQVVNFCHLEKFNVQKVKKRVRKCT